MELFVALVILGLIFGLLVALRRQQGLAHNAQVARDDVIVAGIPADARRRALQRYRDIVEAEQVLADAQWAFRTERPPEFDALRAQLETPEERTAGVTIENMRGWFMSKSLDARVRVRSDRLAAAERVSASEQRARDDITERVRRHAADRTAPAWLTAAALEALATAAHRAHGSWLLARAAVDYAAGGGPMLEEAYAKGGTDGALAYIEEHCAAFEPLGRIIREEYAALHAERRARSAVRE